MNWADLEDAPEDFAPRFYCEPVPTHDKRPEIQRQAAFFELLPYLAPRVLAFPNANAGKRNPMQARREGLMAGVFDITCVWSGRVAFIEFKGHDGRGRAGRLSDAQARFGNRLVEMQVPCACFYTPEAAFQWLGELGYPVKEARCAA